MYRLVAILAVTVSCLLIVPTYQTIQAQPTLEQAQEVTPEKLRMVINACLEEWEEHNFSYNQLEGAYYVGSLTIDVEEKADSWVYNVAYGGLTLIVVESL